MIVHQIKKWSDFSSSSFKPLFWMLMGPMLLLLNFMVIPFTLSLFSFLSFLALLLIWKFRFRGFLIALFGLILSGGFFFFLEESVNFWKITWLFSLSLTFIISFLCFEEVKAYYLELKKESDTHISHLKVSFHQLKEKGASEKRQVEISKEKLEEKLSEANREIKALLQLVDASRIEAQKTYDQNQMLSAESLKQCRDIEILKSYEKESHKKLLDLKQEHLGFSTRLKESLKALNFFRTEYAQFQILFESFQREKLKEKDNLKAVERPSNLSLNREHDKPFDFILKTLEKNKNSLKNTYKKIQLDHRKLNQLLKKAKVEEGEPVEDLENRLLEKERKLEKTRQEIVHLEREIFLTKKKIRMEETPLLNGGVEI